MHERDWMRFEFASFHRAFFQMEVSSSLSDFRITLSQIPRFPSFGTMRAQLSNHRFRARAHHSFLIMFVPVSESQFPNQHSSQFPNHVCPVSESALVHFRNHVVPVSESQFANQHSSQFTNHVCPVSESALVQFPVSKSCCASFRITVSESALIPVSESCLSCFRIRAGPVSESYCPSFRITVFESALIPVSESRLSCFRIRA